MTEEEKKREAEDKKSIASLKKAVGEIDIAQSAPYLIFAWMSNKSMKGGTYPISDDMAEELRSVAAHSLEQIPNREMSVYNGPTTLNREQGMWVPASRINVDGPLFTMLKAPDALAPLAAAELGKRSLALFAIGIGATPANRFFFVKKNARNIRGDTAILGVLRGALRPIKSSIVVLRKDVDFILHDKGAIVFNADAFERFLQDPEDTAAQLDEHLDSMAVSLSFDAGTLTGLKERGRQGTMLRLRIRSILNSGNLPNITIPKIRIELTKLKRAPGDFIKGDKLSFTMERAPFLLSVLDDSAWVGPFSGKVFTSVAATPAE